MASSRPTHLHPSIVLLEWAALRSYVEDVRTPEVLNALTELQQLSDYSTPFDNYRRALELEAPQARWAGTLMAFGAICGALDMKRLGASSAGEPVVGNENGHQFLMSEVEAGLLFGRIALSPGCAPKRAFESAGHAKRAYETVLRFMERGHYNEEASKVLRIRLQKLREVIDQLHTRSA